MANRACSGWQGDGTERWVWGLVQAHSLLCSRASKEVSLSAGFVRDAGDGGDDLAQLQPTEANPGAPF